ncbi:hypothetical protein [Maribacter sp. Asnod1-A12]|uniref:hypothetical protein n=1 Tax=Maribacter sp. Asnod1-A12 TaxID=3160576 RepID=UPI0038677162
MKKLVVSICLLGFITSCQGQVETEVSKQKSVKTNTDKKQTNMLDQQTKIYGQIFDLGNAGQNNPTKGATNYKDLILKMDLPEEQKKSLIEQYNIYNLSADPKKKDSLKIAVGKMLENALEKTKNDPNK